MNNIFRPHPDKFVLVYLDYILTYSKSKEEHLGHLETTLDILRKNLLYAKKSKCYLFKIEIEYLGHIISEDGIRVHPKNIDAVK